MARCNPIWRKAFCAAERGGDVEREIGADDMGQLQLQLHRIVRQIEGLAF